MGRQPAAGRRGTGGRDLAAHNERVSSTMHEMPRILVVDDHPAVRQGLALVLKEGGVAECWEAGGREEALDVARRESPDMALVDLNLGDEDAMALLTELRRMRIPVLVCSMNETPSQVKRAMAAGARGYITKGEAREVARAVRSVLDGWMLISPRAAEGLAEE
jgi:DNA-binding NarL/FixJ family response regulator